MASRAVANIRELEGALIRVVAFASLTNQPITLELAHRVLIRTPVDSIRTMPAMEHIIKGLSKQFPYTLDELRSNSRNKDLAKARHIAMYLMKKMTDKSLRDIGLFLGGRDHSTVMHALAKMENALINDREFSERIKQLEADIHQARS